MEEKPKASVAIIGGGITGLTCAYRLQQRGLTVRLFESEQRVGGAIGTTLTQGWLAEHGPNSLLDGEPQVGTLIKDLALEKERVEAEPRAKHRYVVRAGRLQPLPLSPPALLGSRLFSLGLKARLFAEVFTKPKVRESDVSLARFIGEHFGPEAVAYGLNPFVRGVYAGDPEQLSTRYAFPQLWEIERSHGSILRGQIAAAKARKAKGGKRPKIFSFRLGLQQLTDALAASLHPGSVHLGAPVVAIEATGCGVWQLRFANQEAPAPDTYSQVLLALPAKALAKMRIAGIRPLETLEGIEHPPVASLFLGYRKEQVRHPLDGFGALVPACENRQILGVLFSSSLFPGRAPEGQVALTVMVGGVQQPDLAQRSQEDLLELVKPELASLLGVSGEPQFLRHHFWPKAIPQYNLGYEKHLVVLEACERSYPGIHIGGNSRDGISVPNCLCSGERLASNCLKSLGRA